MKSKAIVLFFLLVMVFAFARANSIESLQDSVAEMHLAAINRFDKTQQFDSMHLHAARLLDYAIEKHLCRYKSLAYRKIGASFTDRNRLDSAYYYYQKSADSYAACGDSIGEGQIYVIVGYRHYVNNDPNKAMLYYLKGIEKLTHSDAYFWLGLANENAGFLYFEQGDYFNALKHYQDALQAFKAIDYLENMGKLNTKMGIIYRKTNDKVKEEKAYLAAIAYLEQIDTTVSLGMAYNNLSELYLDRGKTAEGVELLEKAKEIYLKMDYQLGMCSYYAVMAYYHFSKSPPDYQKVIELNRKSIAIAEAYEDFRQFADASYYLGTALMRTNQFAQAKKVLEKAFAAAQKYQYLSELGKLSEALAHLYEELGYTEKALNTYKLHMAFNDSLAGEQKIKEFTNLDLSYRFKQQQLSDSLKSEQRRLALQYEYESKIRTQKLFNNFVIILALLLLVFAAYMIFARRRLKNRNRILAIKNQQISEQKKEIEIYSRSINKAYVQLQKLDEYKQATTSMLVHDLKNPLNLLVNIDLFESEKEKDSIVKQTSKQMLHLVMNLLDINKAEENKVVLNLKEVELSKIIGLAVQETSYLTEQKNITITNTSLLEFELKADHDLFKRVLVNLLTNAIKYSPNNERITIHCGVTDLQKLRITIKDQGAGIDPKYHQLIFEKFKQVNKMRSGSIGSTGLGLAFCKMAVEAHGWSMGLISKTGEGAEFWIDIPDFEQCGLLLKTAEYHENTENQNLSSLLNEAERVQLNHLFDALKNQPIFAKSDIKAILQQMQQLQIKAIGAWIKKVQIAADNFDSEAYLKLLDQLP